MRSEFKIRMIAELNFFLRVQITQGSKELLFSIQLYERAPKSLWPRKYKTYPKLISTSIKLIKDGHGERLDEHKYRGMIGFYLLTQSRLDIL